MATTIPSFSALKLASCAKDLKIAAFSCAMGESVVAWGGLLRLAATPDEGGIL
jgi:hypothetical protein